MRKTEIKRAKSQKFSTASLDRSFALKHTPAYVIDLELLEDNLRLLAEVKQKAGCKIILAQKAYSLPHTYPLIAKYLDGTTASGSNEALLASEFFADGEIHVYSAAYGLEEITQLAQFCDHILFNSFEQWVRFRSVIEQARKERTSPLHVGLRVNPEYTEQEHAMYDPAGSFSRLGITEAKFAQGVEQYGLDGIDTLHFHTLCEQNSDALANTVKVFCAKFGKYFKQIKHLNLGGGHHITRKDYDLALLIQTVQELKTTYDVEVYLEPGEAVVLDCGFLVSQVLDIVENDKQIAILDTSATCHMPDVLEMPYRPRCFLLKQPAEVAADPRLASENSYQLAGEAGEYAHSYLFGGPTCLAGDVFNEYSFTEPLQIGDRVVFCDMALYSFVKNNTFNGMPLPDIVVRQEDDSYQVIRHFTYEDFKKRLN